MREPIRIETNFDFKKQADRHWCANNAAKKRMHRHDASWDSKGSRDDRACLRWVCPGLLSLAYIISCGERERERRQKGSQGVGKQLLRKKNQGKSQFLALFSCFASLICFKWSRCEESHLSSNLSHQFIVEHARSCKQVRTNAVGIARESEGFEFHWIERFAKKLGTILREP